jgi:hypothetical protein
MHVPQSAPQSAQTFTCDTCSRAFNRPQSLSLHRKGPCGATGPKVAAGQRSHTVRFELQKGLSDLTGMSKNTKLRKIHKSTARHPPPQQKKTPRPAPNLEEDKQAPLKKKKTSYEIESHPLDIDTR